MYTVRPIDDLGPDFGIVDLQLNNASTLEARLNLRSSWSLASLDFLRSHGIFGSPGQSLSEINPPMTFRGNLNVTVRCRCEVDVVTDQGLVRIGIAVVPGGPNVLIIGRVEAEKLGLLTKQLEALP